MSWLWPVLAGVAASTAALAGSGLILAIGKRAEAAATWLTSFAVGTLLGTATFALLPEALEAAPTERVMLLFAVGILGFTAIERILRWRHPPHVHPEGQHAHHEVEPSTAAMVLWGDALHNFIDGLILGTSFSVSVELGVVAAVATIAHEVPQEIGDFAILLGSGMRRGRALLLNYLSAVTSVPGALLAYLWLAGSREAIAWLLPLAAGGFIYIALADLIPSVQHRRGAAAGAVQLALMATGFGVIYAIGRLE